ncbi:MULTISPECIES: hypothetical protein [Salmonella]|uniref:Uncharacterized protein n=2 Tax=Salmonella enterica TaxID=28901 RepID=A0A752MFF2_SALGL|nr:hypothetical protein [Salmonella enterica]MBZ5027200.1 hypothetical protein [Salmonella enterica subsp. enterica serovar Typhimurium]QDX90841.1 hypothetical protein FORC93_b034 [Salmonella enterica subsp. enterica serovar Braenderup]HAF7491356.1 hypothetical protein [Salmonella enterica subsp. enterica serovar Gallinarum]EFW5339543.1 hypothetical protein [Salmonella enterica]EIY4270363.1 hypothetical protein [Salmonella enterica]
MVNIAAGVFAFIGVIIILAFVYGGLLESQREKDYKERKINELEERVYELERKIKKRK